MPSQMIRLRVATEEVGRWKEYAKDSRMSLSAYIRMCVEEKNEGGLSDRAMRLHRHSVLVQNAPVKPQKSISVELPKSGTQIMVEDGWRRLVEMGLCEHGAMFPNCKKWGCKFYEIPNGRR